jgi:hypothetical protein
MKYSKFQKIISGLVIFLLLFSITFHIPLSLFWWKALAADKPFYNLVSILVEDTIYNEIKSKVQRYASDIQAQLENTKVVIIPTPTNAHPFTVASLNESLYFDWYKSVVPNIDFDSKLVWTVFVWKFPLPIASESNNFAKTILPYVDFENKGYIFNHTTWVYEKDTQLTEPIKADIWHGFISSNSWDSKKDIQNILDYFDKNHDFYEWKGLFDSSKGILDGKNNDSLPLNYQPYTFYFDQFRESNALSIQKYNGYEAYLQNLEDISYNRFSKELAEKISKQVLWGQTSEIQDLIKKLDPNFDVTKLTSWPDVSKTSDVSTRYIVQNATNKFLWIFNDSALWEMRKYVYNAWRYNGVSGQINADFIPLLVSTLDLVSEQIVKNANNQLEEQVDNYVTGGLARQIPLLTSLSTAPSGCGVQYTNFLYWKNANSIQNASECSIYRGALTNSGTLVEANRGYNIKLIQNDYTTCNLWQTEWYWGWNSPANLNQNEISNMKFVLNSKNFSWAISSLFDINGAKRVNESILTPSPQNCLKTNLVLSERNEWVIIWGGSDGWSTWECQLKYRIPSASWSAVGWTCNTRNTLFNAGDTDFTTIYKNFSRKIIPECTTATLRFWNTQLKQISNYIPPSSNSESWGTTWCTYHNQEVYQYKWIASQVTHTSPTNDELWEQIKWKVAEALPIDRDRYIDFISAKGNYEKILYPYLYRIKLPENSTLSEYESKIKTELDIVSKRINDVRVANDPSSLSWDDKAIYELLKVSEFPNTPIDLYAFLKNKPLKVYSLGGEEKKISYLDTLVFSLYWVNLNSPSAKYKFIFENYLSDQFGWNNLNIQLPKNKKMYESAYLGAPGDAKSMYVKLDPKDKTANPYATVLSKNILLNTSLLGYNTAGGKKPKEEERFKCWPPDGVPIWEWIPAIICRLKDMLPPKISISQWQCSNSLFTKEELETLEQCDGDVNKNGINDCLESSLQAGSIELDSDAPKYMYNTAGTIRAVLKDTAWNTIRFDNSTDIRFQLIKIETPKDSKKIFDAANTTLVYDSQNETEASRKEVGNYVYFKDISIRADSWEAQNVFSVKNKDANLYFKALVSIKDSKGNETISLASAPLKIEVRGDSLFATSYQIDNSFGTASLLTAPDSLRVSDVSNIYLIDENKQDPNTIYTSINAHSTSQEKHILSLSNYSKSNNRLEINYPLSLKILIDWEEAEDYVLQESQFARFVSLRGFKKAGEYTFIFTDAAKNNYTKKIRLLPLEAVKWTVQLWSTIVESGGSVSTSAFTLLDTFDNVAIGDPYTIEASLNDNSLQFFENGKDTFQFQTVEGYRAFRLKSTENTWKNTLRFTVYNADKKKLFTTSSDIRVIPRIQLDVRRVESEVKVGGWKYTMNVTLRDDAWTKIDDFNSRIYFFIPDTYGSSEASYFEIKNGEGKITYTTKNVASRSVKLQFQVEWLKNIVERTIDILPEKAVKIDLQISKSKMEASPTDSSKVRAILKDRYGNVVFTDSVSKYNLEILPQYSNIIKSSTTTTQLKDGVGEFTLNATDIPGSAYFKIGVEPTLDANVIVIDGQTPFEKSELILSWFMNSGKLTNLWRKFFYEFSGTAYKSRFSTLETLQASPDYIALNPLLRNQLSTFFTAHNTIRIEPVSENAGKIETFYFWNKDKILGKKYNAFYTTLLGSNYGDITQKDYLASSLLFDKENRALAVTSLVNNPNKYSDVITVNQEGKILPVYDTKDITQSINFAVDTDIKGRLRVNFWNESLGNYIWEVTYNFDLDRLFIGECKWDLDTMDDCTPSAENTSVLVRSLDTNYKVILADGWFQLKNSFDQNIFSLSQSGFFTKNANIYLTYEPVGKKYTQFFVHTGEKTIATFLVKFIGPAIASYSNKQVLNTFLDKNKNVIFYYHASSLYSTREIFDGKSKTLAIYYQDPFASDFTLDAFSQSNLSGYENFYKEAGLWRQGNNKTLLLFGNGENVWNSVKEYQTFSVINLGDPVASLKPIKKKLPWTSDERSFDSWIGEVLTRDPDIITYKTLDYNNDNRKDIIVLKKTGYISLLENQDTVERYRNLGNLVYAVDFKWSTLLETGDFTGDGYDDIFFVNKEGKPYLFNNIWKDFSRYSLVTNFALDAKIIQVRSFDMDNDGKDDIVSLDDSGQIHIFYGGGTKEKPVFTKSLIGNGYGLDLNSWARNDKGLVYHDGLYQLPEEGDNSDLIESNEKYLAKVQQSIAASSWALSTDINEYFVDNLIFVRIPYEVWKQVWEEIVYNNDTLQDAIDGIAVQNGTDVTDWVNQTKQDLTDFLADYDDYVSYDGDPYSFNSSWTSLVPEYEASSAQKTFIKSEFASVEWVKVEKNFRDLNGWTLKSWDSVNVQVTLTNTSGAPLKNVAYIETLEKVFTLDLDKEMQSSLWLKPRQIAGYDFIVDGFNIPTGEKVIFNYEVKTLPFRYGYIQAGLFEQWEAGDDIYGDVIVKPSEQNCGELVDIYRSTDKRAYLKGQKAPVCNKKTEADPRKEDKNGNGIPDYLDDLFADIEDYKLKVGVNKSAKYDNPQELTDLLNQAEEDSDSDGIPNQEDNTPTYDDSQTEDEDGDFLSKMNEITDAIWKKIDFITKGLSCWFGWWSCIASPLNWAPLAPGSAPTLFWFPLWPLTPNTWVPVLSGLTGLQTMCWPTTPCCIPTVFPVSPLAYIPWPACWAPSAGWYLWTWAPTNNFRMFITPTITGAMGMAMCFGGPAIAAGFSNPPWLHPIVPGGNCVVAAIPFFGCKDDGSDGDITTVWPPTYSGSYQIYNGNCPTDNFSYKKQQTSSTGGLTESLARDYVTYKKTGTKLPSLEERLRTAFSTVAKGRSQNGVMPFNQPLINLEGGGSNDMSLEVNINPAALSSGNYQDVVNVKMKRVSAFPDFLMDWVTRQIEEIVNKLTDLPTLQIILPDFSGIMDDRWGNFSQNIRKAFESGKAKEQQKQANTNSRITSLQSTRAGLNCNGSDSRLCMSLDLQISKLRGQRWLSLRSISGVNEVYQFLSNLPLIALQPSTVSVNIPWIDQTTLNRVIIDWNMTANQWQEEINRVTQVRDRLSTSCASWDAACAAQVVAQDAVKLKSRKFLSSLKRNIQTLEEYKQLPKKINDLLWKKEARMEQILCNIETISKLMGGWIGKNGKRFQTWVELYILIKSILKSWQLLIDVFVDFEASCHKCKNERHDLMYFIMKLINMIIPKIPIIQFPKWPDIILDLHNVRAGMTIYIPDIKVNLRPLILPSLPKLTLPTIPNVNLNLPALPQLPRIVIPELPDLPSLPTIKLPDLPPPPKIPKLFASLEAILNILKLVTKIMCILKQSPFVPEWRAWDQIAFITERQWYIPWLDFIDISLPQFSFPFVDAIKVTTYVNLEFDNEFIVEMVRQIMAPLNSFSNNIANKIDWNIKDINLEEALPSSIDINVNPSPKTPATIKTDSTSMGNTFSKNLALLLVKNLQNLVSYVETNKNVTVDSEEFIREVWKNLASKSFTADPRLQEVQKVWQEAFAYNYQKEEALTQELLKNNEEKFQVLKDIITTEIEKTRDQRKRLNSTREVPNIVEVSATNQSDFEAYQARLEPYNQKTLQALDRLIEGDTSEADTIKQQGQDIIARVESGINLFTQSEEDHAESISKSSDEKTSSQSKLLSAVTNEDAAYTSTLTNSCALNPDADRYLYKWLYVVEKWVSYRLFDYLDELKGTEEPIHLDSDNDGDDDILYMVWNTLYLKENREKSDTKQYVTEAPLVLTPSNNRFFRNNLAFIESVNGVREADVNDGFINVSFYGPKRDDINNFRLQFYPIVDKLYSLLFDGYTPTDIQKHVIDAFTDIDKATIEKDNDTFTTRDNLVWFDYVGQLPGYELKTNELKNIASDLQEGKVVNINANSKIYAGKSWASLTYKTSEDAEESTIFISKYTNLAFKQSIKIVSISGEAYVDVGRTKIYEWPEIISLVGLPLLPGTELYRQDKKTLTESANIKLAYYDDSTLALDMRETEKYTVYDLWVKSSNHLVRVELPNNFYYLRMQSWRGDTLGNISKQILLSPQKEADLNPPRINLNEKIRVPVYQKRLFDFTPYIYEDGGIKNVADFYIDFNLDKDSDGDKNPKNDRDMPSIQLFKTTTYIKVDFGPYDDIFTKKIGVYATDKNGNTWYKEIDFEVYSPIPTIKSKDGITLNGYINEVLHKEPINIYRVRNGILSKLLDQSDSQKVLTNTWGNYDFATKAWTGLTLTQNGASVALIDEVNGGIKILNPSYSVVVKPSTKVGNQDIFPQVLVVRNGEEIYRQSFNFTKNYGVKLVANMSDAVEKWMNFIFFDRESYGYYVIPDGVPFNPGAFVLYDTTLGREKPLFTILRDGRIFTAGDDYAIEYESYFGKVVFKLMDKKKNILIGKLLLNADASFVIQ